MDLFCAVLPYISDLHLGHANAIGFDNRPFADVTEMNETLIRRWNSNVIRADTVYVLGNFIWEKESLWPAWLERLTGNKVLIRGNHDPRQFSQATKRFFQDIADYREITDTGRHVILCHYPMPFHRADYDEKCFMLYGHIHNTREYAFLEKLRKELREARTERSHARAQFINVGCMMPLMDYTPRTLDEILDGNEKAADAQEKARRMNGVAPFLKKSLIFTR